MQLPKAFSMGLAVVMGGAVLALPATAQHARSGDNPEIIGGTVAPDGKWPAQVALLQADVSDNYRAQFCGGALIHRKYVLTAAHCVASESRNDIEVLVGTQSLEEGGKRVKVKRIAVHPKFDGDQDPNNDVAVLKLAERIPNARLNRLPSKNQETRYASPGTQAYVTGWGTTQPLIKVFPRDLHEAQIEVMRRRACNRDGFWDGDITVKMLCARDPDADRGSCSGDSGGPLVVANPQGKWRLQVGIVSWGSRYNCGSPDKPSVFTRVAKFKPWIKDVIANRGRLP